MIHKQILAGIALLILLTSTVFFIAYRANTELQDIVTSQFNTQQLLLARNIALDIETHFEFIETALTTYMSSDNYDLQAKTRSSYQILKSWQVLALGKLAVPGDQGLLISSPEIDSLQDLGLKFPWDEFKEHMSSGPHSPFFHSQTIKPENGPFAHTHVQFIAAVSQPGMSAPVNADPPLGSAASFILVDAMGIAHRYAHGVVSGLTGYPWVIDNKGYFMYHVEKDFVGNNSFNVRSERNPDISYQRINTLVADKLLKGKEGTDWYISGWHWNMKREMKKLFAYSPALIVPAENDESNAVLWSVGLAVPESEVYGLIQPVVIRQWIVAGIFMFTFVAGLMVLYLISLPWNQDLAGKVEEKTRHLMTSETLLRKEKEKVELSLQALLETQQELVRSERFAAIGEAASHLSHEIKNPLMLMSGFATQVMRTLQENDPGREKLQIVSQEAKRLEKMLNQVRDFTRPQSPSKTKSQINNLIQETVKLVREELDLVNVNLSLNLSPELPEAKVDQSQIKQVLINLVKNAWEATPGGGSITISSNLVNNRIQVTVEDTGAGISKDKQKEIFNPFFTTKDKGTGLGLAVTYRIIQDHQGEIRMDSKLGKGTTFSFYLPLY